MKVFRWILLVVAFAVIAYPLVHLIARFMGYPVLPINQYYYIVLLLVVGIVWWEENHNKES